MQKLKCAVQNYEWGKLGQDSKVAQLYGGEVNSNKPYAELWMGTHKNGPSKLADGSKTLAEFISQYKDSVGVHEHGDLQFLFKVLSVNKALSVQVHPTNEQAKELHKKDPKNYPDDRHKPEIAVALTEFELLCGFREAEDLVCHVKENHEVTDLFDEELLASLLNSPDNQHESLKHIFDSIWKSPQEKISDVVSQLITRIKKIDSHSETQQLMVRLDCQFPGGDVGVLAPIFLNYFKLQPGESTFLGPNEPHAYLSGDCVECMACSDNTIRAGLTPKFKDVQTLCNSLTYRMSGPPYFKPQEVAPGILEYAPPVPEFAVQKITKEATKLTPQKSSSILIVVTGNARLKADSEIELKTGDVIFTPASLSEVLVQDSSSDFCAYRAYTPLPEAN